MQRTLRTGKTRVLARIFAVVLAVASSLAVADDEQSGNALVILERKVKELERRVSRLELLEARCLDRVDGYVNPGATPLEQMPNGAFLPAGWNVERGGDFQLLAKVTASDGQAIVAAKVHSPTDGWCRVLFLRAVDAVLAQP
jgi:hypothetical protein